jgi:predicted adenylyl cyclase CyaB
MKEIEMKLAVKGKTFGELKNIFQKNLTGTEKTQIDRVYLLSEQLGQPIVAGSKVFRIRTTTQGGTARSCFTLKVQSDKALVSDEYEFEVSSAEIANQAMLAAGLVERVTVEKKRIEGKIKNYNLCIDDVKHLGAFIELEVLSDSQDVEKVQSEMQKFLQSVGVDGEICRIPYDAQVEALRKK